jgi:hypothetical protein
MAVKRDNFARYQVSHLIHKKTGSKVKLLDFLTGDK